MDHEFSTTRSLIHSRTGTRVTVDGTQDRRGRGRDWKVEGCPLTDHPSHVDGSSVLGRVPLVVDNTVPYLISGVQGRARVETGSRFRSLDLLSGLEIIVEGTRSPPIPHSGLPFPSLSPLGSSQVFVESPLPLGFLLLSPLAVGRWRRVSGPQ